MLGEGLGQVVFQPFRLVVTVDVERGGAVASQYMQSTAFPDLFQAFVPRSGLAAGGKQGD